MLYKLGGQFVDSIHTCTMPGIHVYFVHTPITNIQYQDQAFSSTARVRTRVKLCLVLPSSLTARDILPNDMMKSYLPTTKREVCRGGNVCERGLKIMCVRETRRHIYVRIEGQQRPCMCIYACERNSVFQLRLVKRVVHSSQKERQRNRESMCVRHPDTLRQIVSICEREMPMHIKCVHLCVRYRDI